MKKSTVFKWGGWGLLAVVVAAGAFAFVSHKNTSSSRVELSDWWQEHRQLLHSGNGDHACDCFQPIISYFKISNITADGATFEWDCSAPSSYQVRYGLDKNKGTEFPAGVGYSSPLYTLHSVTLTGPETQYPLSCRTMLNMF